MIQPNTLMKTSDFYKLFNVSVDIWKKRRDEVLEWATNFLKYEFKNQKTVLIIEQFAEIEPLPKKPRGPKGPHKKEGVENFYGQLVLSSLQNSTKENPVYKPASVLVRENYDIICSKYGHKMSSAEKYMNNALHQYAQYSDSSKLVWINSETNLCRELTEEELIELQSIQTNLAIDACQKGQLQLKELELLLKELIPNFNETLESKQPEDVYKKFFNRAIKKMIVKHPEIHANFISNTQGKYILEE